MLLGGVGPPVRLADVDQGLRRERMVGKGDGERAVPIDRGFFAELAAYLRVADTNVLVYAANEAAPEHPV